MSSSQSSSESIGPTLTVSLFPHHINFTIPFHPSYLTSTSSLISHICGLYSTRSLPSHRLYLLPEFGEVQVNQLKDGDRIAVYGEEAKEIYEKGQQAVRKIQERLDYGYIGIFQDILNNCTKEQILQMRYPGIIPIEEVEKGGKEIEKKDEIGYGWVKEENHVVVIESSEEKEVEEKEVKSEKTVMKGPRKARRVVLENEVVKNEIHRAKSKSKSRANSRRKQSNGKNGSKILKQSDKPSKKKKGKIDQECRILPDI